MTAYLVLDLAIHDLARFQEYIRKVPGFIAKHGGRYRVAGAVPEVMEGDWRPERLVVLEFPSADSAKAFLADPEFAPLVKLRHETTTSKLVLVEGAD